MEIDAGKVTRGAVWLCIDPAIEKDNYVIFPFNALLPNYDQVGYTPTENDFIFYSETGYIYVVSYVEEDYAIADRKYAI